MNEKMIVPEHVVLTEFDDDTGLLVDLHTKKYFQLNETALLIWRELSADKSEPEIINALTEKYQIDESRAAQSIQNFVGALTTQQLIRPH